MRSSDYLKRRKANYLKNMRLIQLWAQGAEVEIKWHSGKWGKASSPDWGSACEFRVKKTPRECYVQYDAHGPVAAFKEKNTAELGWNPDFVFHMREVEKDEDE